jgi:hypothetical protein
MIFGVSFEMSFPWEVFFGSEFEVFFPGSIIDVAMPLEDETNLCEAIQPSLYAVLLDRLKRLAVHTRRPLVLAATSLGPAQHVLTANLVVQRIEPIGRRLLRFRMQHLLEFPNRCRRF